MPGTSTDARSIHEAVPPVEAIPAVLDTDQLAALVGVNVRTLRLWLHEDGKAPKRRWIGNGWRFLGTDVAEWLKSQPVGGRSGRGGWKPRRQKLPEKPNGANEGT